MAITISQAEPNDARGMQEVFYKTWLATYPNKDIGVTVEDIEDRFKDVFTEEQLEKKREQLRNPKEGVTTLLAKDGDTIVGLSIVLVAENNKLQALYVLPEFQGKGIGSQLWHEAQKAFDITKDTIVEVATYNTKAIRFYETLGFVDTGEKWLDEKFIMKSGTQIPEMRMILKKKI